ncbi:MAG TPA: hypothetical protein EYH15_03605 [Methanothermococcus okinawensis]|uniref:Uncharacterized protein n=1 Tax=Methanothermococcus okinawensis TaxID=155863 RepID=A0A832Z803_9EURY|nr:hypothetical protein [Methanococcaceae archaeon]HIP84552.1 hypothetical protein [Methanothermococcus okinawensis]HIP90833.1 hypothetical protein [Methanothermococcus okinawensis]
MESEISKLIDTLCDRELIIRFTLNKTLKISSFKIGTMEIQGEFGISFRNIETARKLEELKKEEKVEEETEELEKEKGKEIVVE